MPLPFRKGAVLLVLYRAGASTLVAPVALHNAMHRRRLVIVGYAFHLLDTDCRRLLGYTIVGLCLAAPQVVLALACNRIRAHHCTHVAAIDAEGAALGRAAQTRLLVGLRAAVRISRQVDRYNVGVGPSNDVGAEVLRIEVPLCVLPNVLFFGNNSVRENIRVCAGRERKQRAVSPRV